MKCDETKPACRHCTRRGIVCAGYPKSFKWKTFVDPETGTKLQEDNVSGKNASAGGMVLDFRANQPGNPNSPGLANYLEDALLSIVGPQDASATASHSISPEQQAADGEPGFDTTDYAELFSEAREVQDETAEENVQEVQTEVAEPANPIRSDTAPTWLSSIGINDFANAALGDSSALVLGGSAASQGAPILYQQPSTEPANLELMTLLFRSQTCQVLSVKHDWEESPWQSLVLPLTKSNAALRHAIIAMTCLQGCTLWPELHARGLSHLNQSVISLRHGMERGTIRVDAALATTLALSLAKTWEAPRTATDYEYMNEAKMLLKQAIAKVDFTSLAPKHARRLHFLANTWIYMDVISRLTSFTIEDTLDVDLISACGLLGSDLEQSKIDPLLGCASELFPLIGKAADLVRSIWKQEKRPNSPVVVAQAAELLRSAENWAPQVDLSNSAEPTCVVSDAIQTAESYRWSMILMLRQAVSALPGFTSHEDLAQKILVYLATVPAGSGAVVVHMFPLLIAGCDIVDQENRNWVVERWEMMKSRMISGIVDRCLELTREAWRRKDGQEAMTTIPLDVGSDETLMDTTQIEDVGENIDFFEGILQATDDDLGIPITQEYELTSDLSIENVDAQIPSARKLMPKTSDASNTLRARLSWLAVMHDWKWQVMLG